MCMSTSVRAHTHTHATCTCAGMRLRVRLCVASFFLATWSALPFAAEGVLYKYPLLFTFIHRYLRACCTERQYTDLFVTRHVSVSMRKGLPGRNSGGEGDAVVDQGDGLVVCDVLPVGGLRVRCTHCTHNHQLRLTHVFPLPIPKPSRNFSARALTTIMVEPL